MKKEIKNLYLSINRNVAIQQSHSESINALQDRLSLLESEYDIINDQFNQHEKHHLTNRSNLDKQSNCIGQFHHFSSFIQSQDRINSHHQKSYELLNNEMTQLKNRLTMVLHVYNQILHDVNMKYQVKSQYELQQRLDENSTFLSEGDHVISEITKLMIT